MQDVLDQRTQRRAIDDAKGDSRLWMTKQRVMWAEKFREHYRKVAEKAG
jgi:hypothetical protein